MYLYAWILSATSWAYCSLVGAAHIDMALCTCWVLTQSGLARPADLVSSLHPTRIRGTPSQYRTTSSIHYSKEGECTCKPEPWVLCW